MFSVGDRRGSLAGQFTTWTLLFVVHYVIICAASPEIDCVCRSKTVSITPNITMNVVVSLSRLCIIHDFLKRIKNFNSDHRTLRTCSWSTVNELVFREGVSVSCLSLHGRLSLPGFQPVDRDFSFNDIT